MPLKEEFKEARNTTGVDVELELAFTKEWDACDWKDWDRAWGRVKIDLLTPPTPKNRQVGVVDHKTGKPKAHYQPQLELYAISGMLRYPQAESAKTSLWYLDHGLIHPENEEDGIYHRRDLPTLQKMWEKRVTPMLSDTKFAPRPGNYCRWCHFRKANGGPCKY